jgi:hypothetical protein
MPGIPNSFLDLKPVLNYQVDSPAFAGMTHRGNLSPILIELRLNY